MRVSVHSETEARKASLHRLLRDGHYSARILEAVEATSQAGNDMIELRLAVRGKDGEEREFRDWLLGNSPRGALKLRHAAEAVGALAKYEAGEIEAEDFPGHDVRVRIVTQKRGGFSQNRIEDYASHPG